MSDAILRFPSGRTVSSCRKDAKRLSKAEKIKLSLAQDRIAILNGGSLDWARSLKELKPAAHTSSVQVSQPAHMTLEDLQAVVASYPITYHGYMLSKAALKSHTSYEAAFKAAQSELLEHLDQCNRAVDFLSFVTKRETINKAIGTSYGLKHDAEAFQEALIQRPKSSYISNGSFICAALHLGFKMKTVASQNVMFNMSSRSPVFEWYALDSREKKGLTPREHDRLSELCVVMGLRPLGGALPS